MDAASIALRLLVYLQSALLLCLVLFASPRSERGRRVAASVAIAGGALSAAGIVVLARSLSESGALFDLPTIEMFLMQTQAGWAAMARALLLSGVAIALLAGWPRAVVILLAALATAMLAGSGHAAAGEGVSGQLQLASDAVHLIAGLAWIGAILAFLWSARFSAQESPELGDRLKRFAGIGTILVAVLLATGVSNLLFIIGWAGLPQMFATTYGRLLLIKLALFAAMLCAAAANRFWLTPRLAGSPKLGVLRLSLGAELALGVGVLGLVAWLGTLDPHA